MQTQVAPATAATTITTKRCPNCKQEKDRSDFGKHKSRGDGLRSWCKPCDSERTRKWRETNPERKREQNRQWREANPERERELTRKWRTANPERERAWSRKASLKRYGLTRDCYDDMLKQQQGRYAMCGDPPTVGRGKKLFVDHDHATGTVRGVITATVLSGTPGVARE